MTLSATYLNTISRSPIEQSCSWMISKVLAQSCISFNNFGLKSVSCFLIGTDTRAAGMKQTTEILNGKVDRKNKDSNKPLARTMKCGHNKTNCNLFWHQWLISPQTRMEKTCVVNEKQSCSLPFFNSYSRFLAKAFPFLPTQQTSPNAEHIDR